QGIFARTSSDIYLLDLKTSAVKKLNLNLPHVMDSWHYWSADSHWLIFSSNRSADGMTALYMAYIDDNGNDAPPIRLLKMDTLKVNSPQFLQSSLDLSTIPDAAGYIEKVYQGVKK
ncbi:MAG TPA: hypothetical protein VGM23_11765, partial [Armatimonadota bacterium]